MIRKYVARMLAALLVMSCFAGNAFAQSYTENFDNITTLTGSGWFQQNNSAPSGVNPVWFQGNNVEVFSSYNGAANAYIAANFNSTAGGTGTISNWLVTPNRTLRNGDVLTFYTRKYDVGQDYPDRLQVRLSTNGASTNVGTGAADLGDFTTLLLDINPTLVVGGYPRQWTQYTITISGLPAPTSGRIAFRYYVTAAGPTGTNSDYIGIDNVVYTQYTCPSFTLTASGALTGGNAGYAYSTTLTQTGALGAPNFAVTAGALPPGLTIAANGTISGTPTANGTFNFGITVNDNSGCSGAQNYSITVTAGTPAAPTSASATAGNAEATITWPSFPMDPYGTPMTGYTVTAVGDSSKTCSTDENGTSCTVTGLTNGQSYAFEVTVTSAGGTSTAATTNAVIPQSAQTIDFPHPGNQVYGVPLTPVATASSGLTVMFSIDSGACAVLPSGEIEFTGVGDCIIRATQPGTDAISAAPAVTQTVTVDPAPQIISFISTAPTTALVGGASYTIVASGGSSDNPVLISIDPASSAVCSLVGNVVSFTAVGSCVINANQAGNAHYQDAPQVQQIVTVTNAPAVATVPVPTLNQWALLLLSGGLLGFAALGYRRSKAN